MTLLPDFIAGRLSDPALLPVSSYRLGVVPGRLDLLYPPAVTAAVRESLIAFDRQLPGRGLPSSTFVAQPQYVLLDAMVPSP